MSEYIKTTPSDVYAFTFIGYNEITAEDVKACVPGLSDACETLSIPPEPPVPIHAPAVLEGTMVHTENGTGKAVPECLWECLTGDTATQATGAAGVGGILEGSLPKRWFGVKVLPPASEFMSVSSIIAHKWPQLDGKLPKWMPNKAPIIRYGKFPPTIKMRPTTSTLRFIGRWIPGIGWGLLAADLIILDQCVANCRGSKSLLRQIWEETLGSKEAF
ncbi:hypothetical protein [Phyllobacterium leguminum]|uniref:Uncharacterized protein n=1 Tax=Phyllobacterium leguminum TaxID=314237 RepID=A0A318T4C6_9HYPH|nr:hypothetical protein [Phyllobacterium leguminum]PYE85144.1 hypothetical protein C7477_1402 [Phyllobacterium leguminum]